MNIVYYVAVVLVVLVSCIIYLARSKRGSDMWSSFNLCPRCGTRMMKHAGSHNGFEQVCPPCSCDSDEFGNSL